MTAIPTEGRVFVAQLTRDLRAREIAGCSLLSPGTKTWWEAFRAFGHAVKHTGSPTKASKLFQTALKSLLAAQRQRACFVNCFMKRSRSAFFEVLTYEVSKHPLLKEGNDGIVINSYVCSLRRIGEIRVGHHARLAFLSWHALGRMKRAQPDVDIFDAGGIVAGCGLAGLLVRESPKHFGTEINFAVRTMICTGVFRFATSEDGRRYGFYDVLTVLPPDDPERQARKIDQGVAIANAVYAYIQANDSDPSGYADKIPVLPFRDTDYVSRTLAEAKELT